PLDASRKTASACSSDVPRSLRVQGHPGQGRERQGPRDVGAASARGFPRRVQGSKVGAVPAPLLVALILLAALLVTGGGHASAVGRRHGILFLEGYVAHPE